MTEWLRLVETGLGVIEGECLVLMGGLNAGLARSLAGITPTLRRVASMGVMDLSRVPVEARRFAYLGAQDGLLPSKDVATNVMLPLRPPAGFMADAVELVGLIGWGPRQVSGLSRYDRQRVALARALAPRPRLLLLDDALAELAPAAQFQFRRLIQKIHAARPELTILMITDRREDALMLADRIAVLDENQVVQLGNPRTLYERPDSELVALALGDVNLLPGRVGSIDDDVAVVALDGKSAEVEAMAPPGCGVGMQGKLAIRPERVAIASSLVAEAGEHALTARFVDTAFLGDSVLLRFQFADGTLMVVKRPSAAPLGTLAPGRMVGLAWPASVARMLIPGVR